MRFSFISELRRSVARKSERGVAAPVIIGIIVAVVFCVALACAGLWWYVSSQQSDKNLTEFAANSVPNTTQVLVSIDLTKTGISPFRQKKIFGLMMDSEPFQKAIKELFPADSGLSLKDDVLPWATPKMAIAFSLLDSESGVLVRDDDGDPAPGLAVVIMPVTDEAKATESATKMQKRVEKKHKYKYTEQKFEGATIHVCDNQEAALSWTVTRGHLYLGFGGSDIKSCLTTHAEGKSLASTKLYQEALKQVEKSDATFVLADLASLVKSLDLQKSVEVKDFADTLGSLRYLVIGAGASGDSSVFDSALVIDGTKSSHLLQAILDEKHNITFTSMGQHSGESDMFFAVNAKTFWDAFVAVAEDTDTVKSKLKNVETSLGRMGVNLNDDVIGSLSGELAYSAKGLGKAQGVKYMNQLVENPSDSSAMLDAFTSTPIIITLGIQDKAKFDAVLDKIPQIKMLLSGFSPEKSGDATIYQVGDSTEGGTAFAFAPKAIMVSIGGGKAPLTSLLSAKPEPVLLSANPVFKAENTKGVALFYQDLHSVYTDMAQTISEHKGDKATVELFQELAAMNGKQIFICKTTKNGLVIKGTSEIK